MISEDYINSVIGKPWVNRAEGPDAFDCWGIVIDSFRKVDEIELPQIAGYVDVDCETSEAAQQAIDSKKYIKCQPSDGAIMAAFFNGRLVHVGRCLSGGVLHSTEGLGVRFDKYRLVTALHQQVEYYKYVDNSSS